MRARRADLPNVATLRQESDDRLSPVGKLLSSRPEGARIFWKGDNRPFMVTAKYVTDQGSWPP